jgi:HEAT repeat protein
VLSPKSAAQIDAEALAERWFMLAESVRLAELGRAMAVGKGRLTAARAVMQRSPARYAAFQAALVRGLGAAQVRMRFECAHALDQFGDDSTRQALAALMDDPVPRVRWIAMHALSCHACGEKPGSLEADVRTRIMCAAASDPSPQVRRHAAVALGLAHEVGAAPMLDAMLARETDAKTLRMAGWARGELDRPARAPISRL